MLPFMRAKSELCNTLFLNRNLKACRCRFRFRFTHSSKQLQQFSKDLMGDPSLLSLLLLSASLLSLSLLCVSLLLLSLLSPFVLLLLFCGAATRDNEGCQSPAAVSIAHCNAQNGAFAHGLGTEAVRFANMP